MSPGVLCRDGFLGLDTRALPEIIDADDSLVAAMGCSHGQIAAAMRPILDKAMACYGTPVKVGGDLLAVYREAMGRIPCPFGDGELLPKGEVELSDERRGQSVLFTPLSVHLIGEHGFYQGRPSRWRLEPDLLADILNLRDTRLASDGPPR